MLVAVLIYLVKYVLSISFIPSPFKSLSAIDTTKVDFVSSRTSPVDVEIVNFFVSKAGVRKEDIGDIDIKRKFTFVDINKKVINKVVDKCNKQKINNRKIEIEIANKK